MSQYRRSSRQCNQQTEKFVLIQLGLNTAEAVDKVNDDARMTSGAYKDVSIPPKQSTM